jgi:hypothetical protein
LYLLFWCIDRIHVDLIMTIVRSEFDDILLTRDDILDLILVQDSLESIKRLSSLLTQLC